MHAYVKSSWLLSIQLYICDIGIWNFKRKNDINVCKQENHENSDRFKRFALILWNFLFLYYFLPFYFSFFHSTSSLSVSLSISLSLQCIIFDWTFVLWLHRSLKCTINFKCLSQFRFAIISCAPNLKTWKTYSIFYVMYIQKSLFYHFRLPLQKNFILVLNCSWKFHIRTELDADFKGTIWFEEEAEEKTEKLVSDLQWQIRLPLPLPIFMMQLHKHQYVSIDGGFGGEGEKSLSYTVLSWTHSTHLNC